MLFYFYLCFFTIVPISPAKDAAEKANKEELENETDKITFSPDDAKGKYFFLSSLCFSLLFFSSLFYSS